MQKKTHCGGCSLTLPSVEGPTHAYMLSSPACWKIYGEVLAREYSNEDYWQLHRLTVDAYALQHPGKRDRRAIQSVNVHLASLYLIFEKNYNHAQATKAIAKLIEHYKTDFVYLERPASFGPLNVYTIWKAENANQHIILVKEWAQTTFEAWNQHHGYIDALLSDAY